MRKTHKIFKSGFKSFISCTLGYHLSLGTSYLTVFTGLLGYSRWIYKIYMKMANKHQTSQSVVSFGKGAKIFMMKTVQSLQCIG